ncbi:TauD/TfdA family dioxygenase [Streptomyces sp. NPDC001351]|uniref:TauD/TfdA family dioxygenase n=1 Tax=Streptomyces sp. NPDC001351 TaxID=3364564 RepID=UPI0036B5273E
MRRAPQLYADAFAHHHIDLAAPGADSMLAAQLRDTGLVTLDGLTSRNAVIAFANRIMNLVPHRDSDSDGLTTIRDTRRHINRAGFAGFGNGDLDPHTERSGTPAPPRLMLLVCGQAAVTGGEPLLTDGRAVHAGLFIGGWEAGLTLSQPRTAFFGAGDGHATQVFTVHRDQRVSVRVRFDGLSHWSPIVQPYVPQLRTAAIRHQIPLPLAPGQGYLLDNERWLHGRRAFAGDRLCWRALGHPRFPMPQGFEPAPETVLPPMLSEAG